MWLLADVVLRYGIQTVYQKLPAEGVVGGTSTEPLTATAAAEHLPAVAAPFRLRPDYDAPYLESLFHDLDRFGQGVPVSRLVRSGARVLGSYVYLLRYDSISPVLHVTARERDVDAVLGHLFENAKAHGAAALVGRVEPHLQEALHRDSVFLFSADARRLIHSHDPKLINVMRSADVLMTLLDGEWWWH